MKKSDALIFTELTDSKFSRPIGAYQIANQLRKNGFTAQVVDFFSLFSNEEIFQIAEKFLDQSSLIIGFSTTFFSKRGDHSEQASSLHYHPSTLQFAIDYPFDYERSKELITGLKQRFPNIKIVIGGSKTKFESCYGADYYIGGYGDTEILRLLNTLKAGKKPLGGKFLANGAMLFDSNYSGSDIKFCEYSMKWDDSDLIFPQETLPIEIGRGCIFRCKFCSYPLIGKNAKDLSFIKTRESLTNELMDNWERFGVTNYMFMDDTHNDNPLKLKLINEISKDLPFKLQFCSYVRHDLMDANRDSAHMMYESGLRSAIFGIETLNQKDANYIGKGHKIEKTVYFLEWLKSTFPDLSIASNFILGLPFESKESKDELIKWLESESCPIDYFVCSPLAIPRKEKYWKPTILQDYEEYGYEFKDDSMNWINRNINNSYQSLLLESRDIFSRNFESGRLRLAGFSAMSILNHGISLQETTNVPVKDLSVKRSLFDLFAEYRQKLFSL